MNTDRRHVQEHMYVYAKYNARKGETPQQAAVRLLRERDQHMSEQFVKVKKLDPGDESLDAFASELGITCDLAEHQALPTLLLMASMKAKPGESAEAALRRLLRERDDEIMQVAQEHDPVRQESLRAAEIKESTPVELFAKVRTNLHDEMMSIAKREARAGETPEQSLVRLIDARDSRISKMYEAANVLKQLHDPSRSREQAESIMEQMAKNEASRMGKGQHEAAASLLRDNADYRKAYSIYVGLQ